jgi:hypothetical protein
MAVAGVGGGSWKNAHAAAIMALQFPQVLAASG